MNDLFTNTSLVKKKNQTQYFEIKNIIHQILLGENFKDILELILLHLEKKIPKARSSIFLYDKENDCLVFETSPNIPDEYCKKIQGKKIDLKIGSCGAAAFFKSTIVTRDTHIDPHWTYCLNEAKKFNLRSSWSVPILNIKGNLYGVFTLYFEKTHKPSEREKVIVSELVEIACLAIERGYMILHAKKLEDEAKVQNTKVLNSIKIASHGELSKVVSHEINNPLAIIQGNIQLINRLFKEENFDVLKCKKYSSTIERSVKRITQVIIALRTLTTESSKDFFEIITFKEIVSDTLIIFKERFNSNDIRFEMIGNLDLSFEARKTQITQVLVNVFNNSVDALSKTKNPWILIDISSGNEMIRIEITDSGNGIPNSIADKIMMPLFTTKILSGSSGLGLSMSQALLEENSGRIYYDNSCNNTRFIIELPLKQILSLKQAV